MSKIENTKKAMRVLDYIAALGVIGYGIYSESNLWIGLGALGLVIAVINPAKLIGDKLQKKLISRKS